MNKQVFLLFFLLVFPLITFSKNVAVINGQAITEKEFKRRYQQQLKVFRYTPPTKENILNDIINFELAVQEAKNKKLMDDPEIKERINMVLVQSVVERALAGKISKINVTDEEVQNYCKNNPELRTSVIFIPLSSYATNAAVERAMSKAKNALKEVKSGKAFEEVVAEYSEGPTISRGGDMGYLLKDKVDPEYYETAKNLKLGKTSDIIRTQFGLHIIKLTGRKPCSNFDNIADWKRLIYNNKKMELYKNYYASLRKKSKISINKSAIKE